MYLSVLGQIVLGVLLVSAARPTRTRRNNGPAVPSNFVTTTPDGRFMVNGSTFSFIGTNAYWLPTLNSEQDINNTLASIKAAGIKVVRTWAFNDVTTIPENGTWFQLVANGTTTINDGPNGLQKLDKVLELAQNHGLYVQMTLTNNWNPDPLSDIGPVGTNVLRRDNTNTTISSRPRNTLSNDYGGMDTYVRQFGTPGFHLHDQFFANQTILNAFMNYTTQIVSRYKDNPFVASWELANDPRCNSSLPTSSGCSSLTVTSWHAKVAASIQAIDPNHLISSGNQGFFCVGCQKLFPRVTAPPAQPSPAPGSRRRDIPKPLTRFSLLQDRKEAWKKTRQLRKKSDPVSSGIRIRGNWVASPTRRQDDVQGMGSAFDGSHGVDSEDILGIPQIGFSSFQLFPDQNSYGPDDPNLPAFNNTLQQGLKWIQQHADLGRLFQKPVSLTGFGLVTQSNAPSFVPFNSTVAPFAPDNSTAGTPSQQFGVTDQQRDDAYSQWLQAGLINGLQGMVQYQWGQQNLTAVPGTPISPSVTETGQSPDQTTTGMSPNDGYSILGQGQESVIGALQEASQGFAPDQ